MPNWLFHFARLSRRLWITVAFYSALGFATALLAAEFAPYVPSDFPLKLGSDSVDDILSILASSMLAVTTFALTTLVAAYTSVIANLSPRAAPLLVADGTVRNALATFVGAFIYSIVGIVAVHTGYYGAQGRVILFFVTLGVLLLVVLAMLRWIGKLSELAQAHSVIERIADLATTAMETESFRVLQVGEPPWAPPNPATPLQAETIGYVQNLDIDGLRHVARERSLIIHVHAIPGDFVHRGEALLWIQGDLDRAGEKILRSRVTIGAARTFDQDPLFGLQVLGEIAARALSPGVNDPGTAREVITRSVTAIDRGSRPQRTERPSAGELWVRPVAYETLLAEVFRPVIQHGAADLGLQLTVQAALRALTVSGVSNLEGAARAIGVTALAKALAAAQSDGDRVELTRAAVGLPLPLGGA